MGLEVLDLGLVQYQEAMRLQRGLVEKVARGERASALIICSHYPVITVGRGTRGGNILAAPQELMTRGIAVFASERGGDVTYHGPGQLVLYPVVDLRAFRKDLHWFLRSLESWALTILDEAGVSAQRRAGLTGAWVKEKKICSIGICVKNWVSFHGLSLNVTAADRKNFSLIRPCGMDIEMTSIEDQGGTIDVAALKTICVRRCVYG